MNKQDLIEKIALAAELNKAAATRTLDAVLDGITAALKAGDTVTLAGFGTFSVSTRAARRCCPGCAFPLAGTIARPECGPVRRH